MIEILNQDNAERILIAKDDVSFVTKDWKGNKYGQNHYNVYISFKNGDVVEATLNQKDVDSLYEKLKS